MPTRSATRQLEALFKLRDRLQRILHAVIRVLPAPRVDPGEQLQRLCAEAETLGERWSVHAWRRTVG